MKNPDITDYMAKLPTALREVLEAEGISNDQLSHRYSDLFIESNDRAQLGRIAKAGVWEGMSEVFTSESNGKPTLEIGLALLDVAVTQQQDRKSVKFDRLEGQLQQWESDGVQVPLYCQHPGQTTPQDAYLEVDLRSGEVTVDHNAELGNAVSMDVYHGRVVRIPINKTLTPQGIREEVLEHPGLHALLSRLVAGATPKSDEQGNAVVRLNADANAALGLLETAAIGADSAQFLQPWSAEAWFSAGVGHSVTAATTDEEIAEVADHEIAAALEDKVLIERDDLINALYEARQAAIDEQEDEGVKP